MSLEARRWLLEPAVPDAVRFPIVTDLEIKATPEVCQALEALALELEKSSIYQARPINCTGVEITECNILVNCPAVTLTA